MIEQEVKPIRTAHLFAPLAHRLIALLRSLEPEQWAAPTCYPSWKVKDIASHLLQTGIGRLAAQRDGAGAQPDSGPVSFDDVTRLVAANNERWEKTAAAFSPGLIIDLLAATEPALARFFPTLDPAGPAFYAVGWAGESHSQNWFDMAREYTERWHHQAQIREAVGAPALNGRCWLTPVLDTLMRALPFWFASEPAAEGTEILVAVTGAAGGEWILRKADNGWRLSRGAPKTPAAARVIMPEEIAWKFLTRSLSREQARPLMQFEGDEKLTRRFLDVKAILMED